METETYNTIGSQGQGSSTPLLKNNKTWLIITIVLGIIVAILAVAIIMSTQDFGNTYGEDDEERFDIESVEIIIVREETPLLELYSEIDDTNTVTIAEILSMANEQGNEVKTVVYDDGTGYLTFPGYSDMIAFDHGHDNSENQTASEEETDLSVEETVNEILDYPSDMPINNIRYIYDIDQDGYSIGYNDETGYYEVYDMDDVYEIPDKEEAIEAYLAPVLESTSEDDPNE